MENKNFCCERLSFFNRPQNKASLNFRIVKYIGDFRKKMLLLDPKADEKGFVITSGYEISVNDEKTMRMVVNYCPFCGQKLSDFYKSDDYVQEIIG
ncbi:MULTISPECIES: hypothetical protein [Chryseobacterium]|uniref:Uncharacterized protein n=1 Tax=Chryseobacterium metallicongregator TaxID=3073042 RepID=A0ABU1E622_9FLAO|nr:MULTISPECIES: hypothetical protein [Chryseobacterium]MDH5035830.1 hypothetical protein [Chryseobacterium cucumeris]MDR4953190.1 hypothetical protein [Chryseobacterium sp. ES2]